MRSKELSGMSRALHVLCRYNHHGIRSSDMARLRMVQAEGCGMASIARKDARQPVLIRFSLWLLTHTLYRIRVVGQEHVPVRGPALLVCNHVSFIDGLLVGGCVQRFIRFLIYRPIYEHKALHWLLRHMQAIPVQGRNAREVVTSLARAQEELRQGHVVCIFAE